MSLDRTYSVFLPLGPISLTARFATLYAFMFLVSVFSSRRYSSRFALVIFSLLNIFNYAVEDNRFPAPIYPIVCCLTTTCFQSLKYIGRGAQLLIFFLLLTPIAMNFLLNDTSDDFLR